MFTPKKTGQLETYFDNFLGPHIICGGNVEVWDQTLGCPECRKELWSGRTSEDAFYAEHPFIFDNAHDDGDAMEWSIEAYSPDPPFGGWREPSYPPQWHYDPPLFSWPSGSRAWEHNPPPIPPIDITDWTTNHDPGDV